MRIKLDDLLLIGSDPLNTTAQKLTGAVNELDGKIDNIESNDAILGAKNFLSYPYLYSIYRDMGYSSNNVNFTDNGDGTVTVSTTNAGASADAYFTLSGTINNMTRLKNGNYKLTGCPSGGSLTSYYTLISKTVGGTVIEIGSDTGDGLEFTANGDDFDANYTRLTAVIMVKAGTVITTPITFRPMIRLASDTDDTYYPYAATNEFLSNGKIFRLLRMETAAADAELIFPKPVNNGGTITYRYDPKITPFSIVIPIFGIPNSGIPVSYKYCKVTTSADGGYATIKLTSAISNVYAGILVIN